MKKLVVLILGLLFVPAFHDGTAIGQQKKVLVIGIDGLRADAMEAANTPNIDALIANGTYSRNATTSDLTFSGPGWSDILFGIHRHEHGVATNSTSTNPNNPAYQIFTGSNQHQFNDILGIANTIQPSLQTARFTGDWNPIHTTRSPTGDEYTFKGTDNQAAADAASFYANNNADVGFLYFAEPDFAGHSNGFHPNIQAYKDAISNTDAQIGQVITAIQNRAGFQNGTEDWVFILASDHGGDSGGGHSGNMPWQREVPLIVSGNSVNNGVLGYDAKNIDVVPTALAHLGIAAPNHIRGHVIGLNGTPDPRPQIQFGTNLVFNGDAEFDVGFTDHGMDQKATGWNEHPDSNFLTETSSRSGTQSITILEYGTPGGFPGLGDSGPADRGDNFFSAGAALGQFGQSGSEALMTQTIDLSSLATMIDSDEVDFELSAWLGGFSSQEDKADFIVRFLAADGITILGTANLIGPDAAARGDQTGLFFMEVNGDLLVGTRFVELELHTFGNDGYADNLSFVLTTIPEPGSSVVVCTILLSCGIRRRKRHFQLKA